MMRNGQIKVQTPARKILKVTASLALAYTIAVSSMQVADGFVAQGGSDVAASEASASSLVVDSELLFD